MLCPVKICGTTTVSTWSEVQLQVFQPDLAMDCNGHLSLSLAHLSSLDPAPGANGAQLEAGCRIAFDGFCVWQLLPVNAMQLCNSSSSCAEQHTSAGAPV